VLTVLTSRHDELGGRTDHVLATGTRRWAPLASQLAVTAVGCIVVLIATATLTALVAPAVIDGKDVAVRAFAYVVGQWPAAVAMAAWTAVLIGLAPRLTWLAWVPLVLSGALALLGQLLGVPSRIRDLGLFQHVPDIAAPSPDIKGLLILLAVASGASLLGVVGTVRRDVTTG
jgi:ABC-2 type transport system permease protein